MERVLMPALPAKRCSSFLPLTFHWFVAASCLLLEDLVVGWGGGRRSNWSITAGKWVCFLERRAPPLYFWEKHPLPEDMMRLRVACHCVCVWLCSSAVSLWLIYHCLSNYHTGPSVFLGSAADTLTHSGSFLLPMQIKAPVNICF